MGKFDPDSEGWWAWRRKQCRRYNGSVTIQTRRLLATVDDAPVALFRQQASHLWLVASRGLHVLPPPPRPPRPPRRPPPPPPPRPPRRFVPVIKIVEWFSSPHTRYDVTIQDRDGIPGKSVGAFDSLRLAIRHAERLFDEGAAPAIELPARYVRVKRITRAERERRIAERARGA
jgi:hypothetical protein